MESINLPASLDTIHSAALQGCKALKSIDLPKSLKDLEERAFKGCESLTTLVVPDAVTAIGTNAFEDCSSLKEVTVGNGVKEIGQWAFYDCTAMEKLTLGSSLETIGAEAFDGDVNIREITCLSVTPPSFPGGFPDEVLENATVTVPEGSEEAYNSDPEWDPMVEGEVQKAESILLNYTEIELQLNESVTLTAEVLPADAVNKEVTWTSDDYYVAKVDENGNVTAKGYGDAVITASCGDVKAECIVKVRDADGIDSVLSGSEKTIDVFDTNGILLLKGVRKDALDTLTPGLYILRRGDRMQKLVVR
ncbi:MAG: leucine-rich repeat protein [Muribaculaceae bacterium]|nr:leucine-rich repeat protein [Muribaculaceae bacterium]